jgi:hypothetical protein
MRIHCDRVLAKMPDKNQYSRLRWNKVIGKKANIEKVAGQVTLDFSTNRFRRVAHLFEGTAATDKGKLTLAGIPRSANEQDFDRVRRIIDQSASH